MITRVISIRYAGAKSIKIWHFVIITGKEGFPDQSQQAYVKQLCLRLRYPRFTPTTQRRNRKGA